MVSFICQYVCLLGKSSPTKTDVFFSDIMKTTCYSLLRNHLANFSQHVDFCVLLINFVFLDALLLWSHCVSECGCHSFSQKIQSLIFLERMKVQHPTSDNISNVSSNMVFLPSLSIGHKVQDLCDIYVSFYTLKVENNKNFSP